MQQRTYTKARFLTLLFAIVTMTVQAADETIAFSTKGYSDGTAVTSVNGTSCTITFDKGTNSNAPKYYTSGTAIRAYGGNTMTVASTTKTIEKIEITFGTSDGSNAITTNVNTYNNGTWTGSASSVVFTIGGSSGNRRIQKVEVTYSEGSGTGGGGSGGGTNTTLSYYANADGKMGSELKTAMCVIILPHTKRSYDNLWTDFQTTDKRDDGKVWDMYSCITNYTFGTDQAGNYSNEGDKYNREHSFPKSWFGGGESTQMYTDLHHMYPTDGKVNGMRSNYPFGETNGEDYKSAYNFSKLGTCTYPGYSGTVFEPADEYKGDFARTYFYMVTCYENQLPTWYTSYSDSQPTLDGNKYPGLSSWQLNMLMAWAKADPVSEKETNRNNAVYSIQNNRNPFIDYPGLEEYIWGTLTTTAFSYDNYVQPGNNSGKQNVTMSFSPASASATVGEDFTEPTLSTTPSGLTVTYSSTTPSVATVDPSTGEVTLVAAGETTITATFAGNETYNAGSTSYILTVSSSSVTPVTGNQYELYSGVLVEGDYIIYYNGKAMNTTVTSDRLQYEAVTPINDVITTDNASIVWHIAPSGNYWTIYNAAANKYAASTGTKNQAQMLASGTDNKSLWTVSGTSTYEFVNKQNTTNEVNANLRNNGTYGFACYGTGTGGALSLYKRIATTPLVTVPTLEVDEDGITSTSVPVSWTTCDNVTEYTLQIASDNQFTNSTAGSQVTIFSNDANDPNSTPSDWTYSIANSSGSYLQLTASSNYVISEAFDASNYISLTISYKQRTYGGTATNTNIVQVQYSTDNGVSWTNIGTTTATSTTLTAKELDASAVAGMSPVRLRFSVPGAASGKGCGISNIVLAGVESVAGSIISSSTVNGTEHTFTGLTPETTYYTRVKGNADWSNVESFTTNATISLVSNDNNSTAINTAATSGKKYDTTLSGRTLYKDGNWNTLCLPFNLTISGSVLNGADVRTLVSSNLTGSTLTLNFTEQGGVSTMLAGVPYIIKWTSGDNIENPTFTGVTISNVTEDVETNFADFIGTYDAFTTTANDKTMLFLRSDNKLYYTTNAVTFGAFRAYFKLHDAAANAKDFVLNFGENEVTSIDRSTFTLDHTNDVWYTLDGRRLNGRPTQKGLYIMNGKKYIIK